LALVDLDAAEDNIVTRIKNAGITELLTIEALGHEEEVRRQGARTPACFVVFEGDAYSNESELIGDEYQLGNATWRIFIISINMRGPKAGRKGAAGTYTLSRLVAEALLGFDPVNNVQVGASLPLRILERQQFEDQEKGRYVMLLRMVHPTEAVE
jgi:hypothetical protein